MRSFGLFIFITVVVVVAAVIIASPPREPRIVRQLPAELSADAMPPAIIVNAVNALSNFFHKLGDLLVPPQVHVSKFVMKSAVNSALYVAVKANIPEILLAHNDPMSAAEIAAKISPKTDPIFVYRILRCLATQGFFNHHHASDKFSHNDLSILLVRNDKKGSHGNNVMAFLAPDDHMIGFNNLLSVLYEGGVAFDNKMKKNIWEHYSEHPEMSKNFDLFMDSLAFLKQVAVRDFDFSSFRSIVDVGGGSGVLLKEIVAKQGGKFDGTLTVFEMPRTIERMDMKDLTANGITAQSGDFFKKIEPKNADLYTLSFILHDWDDEKSIKILKNIRSAMHDKSKILVLDHVIDLTDTSVLLSPTIIDITMMAVTGGLERTRAEFASLAAKSGLRLTSSTKSRAGISLTVLEPAL